MLCLSDSRFLVHLWLLLLMPQWNEVRVHGRRDGGSRFRRPSHIWPNRWSLRRHCQCTGSWRWRSVCWQYADKVHSVDRFWLTLNQARCLFVICRLFDFETKVKKECIHLVLIYYQFSLQLEQLHCILPGPVLHRFHWFVQIPSESYTLPYSPLPCMLQNYPVLLISFCKRH